MSVEEKPDCIHSVYRRVFNLDKGAKKEEMFAKQLDSIVIFRIHYIPSAYYYL
jgi:hypothetical protein